MDRFVYGFADGGRYMDDLLGGKGAGLAEMTRMGLPVPPGFTITTQACRAFLATGAEPATLAGEVTDALAELASQTLETFGPGRPLLFAVRSGGKSSMPGMMDTVLNIGLDDQTVEQLAAWSGDPLFAWVSYARFVRSFAETVLGLDPGLFDAHRVGDPREPDAGPDASLEVKRFRALARAYQRIVHEQTGEDFPQDPRRQLDLAVRAVFASWNGERARIYRKREHIPDGLGTAVNVCLMVFGNLGWDSGTGVAFTRDPATGARGDYGDYLRHAVGEDIVAGVRNASPLGDLKAADPASHAQLHENMRSLESHYRDMCDIEFTVEHGTLWMLQTRIGKRSAEASFRIAVDLGRPVILVRPQTRPEDLKGMLAADGILTSSGGKTSHAAVVARGLGRPCVCGAEDLDVNVEERRFTAPGWKYVREGDFLSIDGSTGAVYQGRIPVVPSAVVRHFQQDDEQPGHQPDSAAAWSGRPPKRAARPALNSDSACAGSTAATRTRSTSSTTPGSTTSPVPPTGSWARAWRPAGRRCWKRWNDAGRATGPPVGAPAPTELSALPRAPRQPEPVSDLRSPREEEHG